jgi:hypothetical protein
MRSSLVKGIWLGLVTAAGALAWAGCGGPQQPGYWGPGQQQQPQQGYNNQMPGQQGAQPAGNEQMIGDLLAGINTSGPPPTAAPTQNIAQPPAPPAATAGGGGGGGGGDRLNTFDEDVGRIRQIVPGWDNGTGLTILFLKESTGKRLSLIYVDPTPPVFKDGPGLWMIQAKATANNQVLGWAVILLKNLAPGHYTGNPSQSDVVLAVCMGETWDGKNPETTWSINPGSYAEIDLRPGTGPGDLEGNFRGKLVDNKNEGFHTIENGYIYINR